MPLRQQILYLWLAEGALDTRVIAWAFHDGTGQREEPLPDTEPPYETGLHALKAGWLLLQSPAPRAVEVGTEHDTGYLANEFVFERRFEIPD